MENRINELLHKKEQYLQDGEVIILVKDEKMSVRYNDGDSLTEVNGELDDKLSDFLIRIKDETN